MCSLQYVLLAVICSDCLSPKGIVRSMSCLEKEGCDTSQSQRVSLCTATAHLSVTRADGCCLDSTVSATEQLSAEQQSIPFCAPWVWKGDHGILVPTAMSPQSKQMSWAISNHIWLRQERCCWEERCLVLRQDRCLLLKQKGVCCWDIYTIKVLNPRAWAWNGLRVLVLELAIIIIDTIFTWLITGSHGKDSY